jgi:hypothetical protein
MQIALSILLFFVGITAFNFGQIMYAQHYPVVVIAGIDLVGLAFVIWAGVAFFRHFKS